MTWRLGLTSRGLSGDEKKGIVFSKFSGKETKNIHELMYEMTYYRHITLQGETIYSSDILLPWINRVVIDDKNIKRLRKRIKTTIPATMYSRAMAAG